MYRTPRVGNVTVLPADVIRPQEAHVEQMSNRVSSPAKAPVVETTIEMEQYILASYQYGMTVIWDICTTEPMSYCSFLGDAHVADRHMG